MATVAAASPAAAGGAASVGAVGAAPAHAPPQSHSHLWPVYQSPLWVPSAVTEPNRNNSTQAHGQTPRASAAPAAAAAATQVACTVPGSLEAQSSSGHSTPQDSARDLEAGQPLRQAYAQQEAKAGSSGSGSGSDSKPPPLVVCSAGDPPPPSGAAAADMFGALQYRLMATPPCANGTGAGAEAPSGRPKAMVRTRVEPKTFFANERTFLQWLQISVLVMMTAVSMLNGSGLLSTMAGISAGSSSSCDKSDRGCFASKLSGAIIAPVALLFMAYALYMYRKRTYQILRRETVRYDDQRGPAVLVVILLLVFTLSYVLSMVFIF